MPATPAARTFAVAPASAVLAAETVLNADRASSAAAVESTFGTPLAGSLSAHPPRVSSYGGWP